MSITRLACELTKNSEHFTILPSVYMVRETLCRCSSKSNKNIRSFWNLPNPLHSWEGREFLSSDSRNLKLNLPFSSCGIQGLCRISHLWLLTLFLHYCSWLDVLKLINVKDHYIYAIFHFPHNV